MFLRSLKTFLVIIKRMFAYIITIIVTIFIVSIITEHMVIKRLQMSPGVEIKNGRCRLKEGFGPEMPPETQVQMPRMAQRNMNEIHDNWYRPFVN